MKFPLLGDNVLDMQTQKVIQQHEYKKSMENLGEENSF